MSRLTGNFETDLPPPDALAACADAIDGLGWEIASVTSNQIISYADTESEYPAMVEIEVSDSGPGSDVRITGSDADKDSLERDELVAELDRVRGAIRASIEAVVEASAVTDSEAVRPTNSRSSATQPSGMAIQTLLCPTEESRFYLAFVTNLLALVALAAILVLVFRVSPVAVAILVLLVLVLLVLGRIHTRLDRSRLLGRAMRVTAASLPEVHAVVTDVCKQLGYTRPIDVYVIDNADVKVSVFSYLGTRIILIDGSLVAGLLETDRAGLTFLIGRSIGQLRAEHQRFELMTAVLSLAAPLVNFPLSPLGPLTRPYGRATVYSGDQIGLVCCGDLGAALATLERLLVGNELSPRIDRTVLIEQAEHVRAGLLPRLAQLMQPVPHLTNRYLNLMFFARRRYPESLQPFISSMTEQDRARLDALWDTSPHCPASDYSGPPLGKPSTVAPSVPEPQLEAEPAFDEPPAEDLSAPPSRVAVADAEEKVRLEVDLSKLPPPRSKSASSARPPRSSPRPKARPGAKQDLSKLPPPQPGTGDG